MTESLIEVAGTDKSLETAEFDNSSGAKVHREGVFIGSPNSHDAKAEILQGTYGRYGLNIVSDEGAEQSATLQAVLDELKLLNRYMSHISCIDLRGESDS